jgi:hypothetical protein
VVHVVYVAGRPKKGSLGLTVVRGVRRVRRVEKFMWFMWLMLFMLLEDLGRRGKPGEYRGRCLMAMVAPGGNISIFHTFFLINLNCIFG